MRHRNIDRIKKCSLDSCSESVYAKGLCRKHYTQLNYSGHFIDLLDNNIEKVPLSENIIDIKSDKYVFNRLNKFDIIGIVKILFKHKVLSEREERVLSFRFGISNQSPMLLDQVAKTLLVSRERVRQIECSALKKLKCLVSKMNINAAEVLTE